MKSNHNCCNEQEVKKGRWSVEEDETLFNFITNNGEFHWCSIPELTGLKRCGKACRSRWMNYLHPDLRHQDFTREEIDLINHIQASIGNKWAEIARHLPGRSASQIRNFCNSNLKNKTLFDDERHAISSFGQNGSSPSSTIIHPPYILESSDPHRIFTPVTESGNLGSSQCLMKTSFNSTITIDNFQQNPHSSIAHNLDQQPPSNFFYTTPSPSQPFLTVNQLGEGFRHGHNIPIFDVPTIPNPPLSSSFSMSTLPTYGQLNSPSLAYNNQIMSPFINTSLISMSERIIPTNSSDHQQTPFHMLNTSSPPNNGLLPPRLSHHGYVSSPTFDISSIPTYESMNSNLPIGAKRFPFDHHMSSTSFSSNGNDDINTYGDPSSFDINEFFHFDMFENNLMDEEARKAHSTHEPTTPSEVHTKSHDIDMPTN